MEVKIDYVTRTIDIIGNGYSSDNPYWIAFDRFNTLEKLVQWLKHLSQKNWCTKELLSDLIDAYSVINKYPIYHE